MQLSIEAFDVGKICVDELTTGAFAVAQQRGLLDERQRGKCGGVVHVVPLYMKLRLCRGIKRARAIARPKRARTPGRTCAVRVRRSDRERCGSRARRRRAPARASAPP